MKITSLKFLLFVLTLSFGLNACKFAFEHEIDLPETDALLNVHVKANNNENPVIFVTNAVPAYLTTDSTNYYQPVNNCSIELFQDGTLYERVLFETDGIYKGQKPILKNHEYSLNVSSPDYDDEAKSTFHVPENVLNPQLTITRVDTSYEYDTYNSDYVSAQITVSFDVSFDNIPNVDEYYYFSAAVFSEYIDYEYDYTYYRKLSYGFDINFPAVNDEYVDVFDEPNNDGGYYSVDYHEFVYFNDERFDGEKAVLHCKIRTYENFSTHNNNISKQDLKIKIAQISPDLYRYYKSLKVQNDNSGNPFAEPVPIHNMFTGGMGSIVSMSPYQDSLLFFDTSNLSFKN